MCSKFSANESQITILKSTKILRQHEHALFYSKQKVSGTKCV
jgi:hypothetical protein